MNGVQLLVFDLDGTLLEPDHRLSDARRALLLTLRDRGIETTIATGRLHAAALPFIEALDIRVPVILYNGALVAQPDGTPLCAHSLAASDTGQVSRAIPSRS